MVTRTSCWHYRRGGTASFLCAARIGGKTGFSAQQFIELGQVTPLAGFCDEIQHLFVAKNLSKTARYSCDEDEVIEVLFLTPQELERKIVFGDITDSKTIACLSKAKLCGYL